jgi:hypothetical protein
MASRTKQHAHRRGSHAHGEHCADCGNQLAIQAGYTVTDRFMRPLFLALCKAERLTVTTRPERGPDTLYVIASDHAALDRLNARSAALCEKLDARLFEVAEAFIREHCPEKV